MAWMHLTLRPAMIYYLYHTLCERHQSDYTSAIAVDIIYILIIA